MEASIPKIDDYPLNCYPEHTDSHCDEYEDHGPWLRHDASVTTAADQPTHSVPPHVCRDRLQLQVGGRKLSVTSVKGA